MYGGVGVAVSKGGGWPISHFRFSAILLLGGCTRNIESPSSEFAVGSVCDRSYPLAFACYVPKS
jgi:hypothetical protein